MKTKIETIHNITNITLAQKAIILLQKQKLKIATAESCTGGLLAYHFISIDGASTIFDGGMISYANSIKNTWLGVGSDSLQTFGAVSEIVVRQMCKGIIKQSGADVGLATSGIAGPSGGSNEKPVGTVFIGIQFKNKDAIVKHCQFSGNRNEIQIQTCNQALEMLIDLLQSR